MDGYAMRVTCGECAGAVEAIASTTSTGSATNGVCRCVDCGAEWFIAVQMRRLPKPETLRRQQYRRGGQQELVMT